MAKNKDPAFMFYPADYIVGTRFMTHEQKGKYMDLLCYQHQLGHLSEDDMLDICGERDNRVFSKFIQDEQGLYYNVRLEEEINKREAYKEKLRANGSLGGKSRAKAKLEQGLSEAKAKLKQSSTTRVENDNDNENINKDIIHYLNTKLGTKYKASAEYVKKHINARLNEGYTLEDFKTVIDKKYKEWNGTEFAKFLRPETLFGTKFSTYLNQLGAEVLKAKYTSFSADDALERALQRAYKED